MFILYKASYFLLLRQDPSEYSTQSPVNYDFSSMAKEQALYLAPCEHLPGTVFSNPFKWFFPWPQVVSSYTRTDKYSTEYLMGDPLQISRVCSLSAALSSLVLSPVNSSSFGLPRLSTLISSTQEVCQVLPRFSLLALKSGNSKQ